MSFDQLIQLNAIEMIGDKANLPTLEYFEQLDSLSHQLSLKNSKPFRVKKDRLEPTEQLYKVNEVVLKTQNSNAGVLLATITEHTKVKKTSLNALNEIQSMLNQYKWFQPLSINQNIDKQQIHIYLNALWNKTRGYNSTSDVERDNTHRDMLIKDQRTENSRMVSRLLTKHSKVHITKLMCSISITGSFPTTEISKIEKEIVKLKTIFISQLQRLNQAKLFCIQWRIQRTLFGLYYLNVLVYHSVEHKLKVPQDNGMLTYNFDDTCSQAISLYPQHNIQEIVIEKYVFQGIPFERWKVIFNNMLYPLKYYYYQSKTVSPKFSSVIY